LISVLLYKQDNNQIAGLWSCLWED